jgi:thiamine biosynthesis lipoprotein
MSIPKNILLYTVLFIVGAEAIFAQSIYSEKVVLMGSNFEITVVAENQVQGDHYINLAISEISRIERLISSWDENSQTSLINRNSGIKPISVDPELFSLIERSIKISNLTDGAFDISYASMDNIWKFDGSMTEMPNEQDLLESVSKVGFKNIELDETNYTVFLRNSGMRIGFGAIGKGYAADKAKELLLQNGVTSGIINASGDLNAWGKQPDGSPWMVAIVNPLNKEKVFSWLPVEDMAVVTSGNYEKFVTIEGVKYSHIIDPRTGMPSSGISSVTILTKSAELADALATSVYVMGVDTGLNLINQLKGVEAIIVDSANHISISDNIDLNNIEL